MAGSHVRHLSRAVLLDPAIVWNVYHFGAEMAPYLHRMLCHDLGACRYYGGQLRGSYGRGTNMGDPSRDVAADDRDYGVIVFGEAQKRWEMSHVEGGLGRKDHMLPIAADILRCFHPSPIWMVSEDATAKLIEGITT